MNKGRVCRGQIHIKHNSSSCNEETYESILKVKVLLINNFNHTMCTLVTKIEQHSVEHSWRVIKYDLL